MQRTIKFRAWDKTLNKIHCWSAIENHFTLEELLDDNFFEAMQYTGLKDKNDIEIYEGDILFHPLQGKRRVFYPYSETVASYGLRNVDNGMGSTLQDAHRVWEIIGNIYENPEFAK